MRRTAIDAAIIMIGNQLIPFFGGVAESVPLVDPSIFGFASAPSV